MRVPVLVVIGGLAALGVAGCGSSNSTSGGGAQGGDYCTAAKAVRDSQAQINVLGTATSIADEKSGIGSLVAKVDAAAAAAPSAISADWATVRGFFDLVNGAVQSASDTSGAASNVLALESNSAASTASSALNAAGKHIDTFTQAQCGFAISTPTPGAASSST